MAGAGALIPTFFTWLGGSTFGAIVVRAIIITAVSYALQRRPPTYRPGIDERSITSRGTVEPQKLIYGETLVSGPIAIPSQSTGLSNRDLWNVIILAGHECSAITDVYLDDVKIPTASINSAGLVTAGFFGPAPSGTTITEIHRYLGSSTQVTDTGLQTALGNSVWTNEHRLRGLAYLVTKFTLFQESLETWEKGEPAKIRALVKGKIIYDPRLDTAAGAHPDTATYFAWSDNPALCLADYLRDEKFGPRRPIQAARIDWAAVVTAANACDVLVVIPGATTEKRFTCNGVLYGSEAPKKNIEQILSSMNGELVVTGGHYIIKAGVYEAPTDTLTEDDIVGPVGITKILDGGGHLNTLKSVFVDPDRFYQPTETAPISVAGYVTEDDGVILEDSIDLDMTNSWYMAQRITVMSLNQARLETSVKLQCNLTAARLQPGQRINLQIPARGWTPKIFKVLSWRFASSPDGTGVEVELREDKAVAYSDPPASAYNTRASTGLLVSGDPAPINPRDAPPLNMHIYEGITNIRFAANQGLSAADAGEIRLSSGQFRLPTDVVRGLSVPGVVKTPYDGAAFPPDGRSYVVWGSSNPVTRFGGSAGDWGTSGVETAGLFHAVFDRVSAAWIAVSNLGTNYAVTPQASDYVFLKIYKYNSTPALDLVQLTVPFDDMPIEIFTREDFADADIGRFQNRWNQVRIDSGEQSLVSGITGQTTEFGWRFGNNSGNDTAGRIYDRRAAIPMGQGDRFQLTVWYRRTAGTGRLLMGVQGWKGDYRDGGGTPVDSAGAATIASNYIINANPANSEWTFYTAYFIRGDSGFASTPDGTLHKPFEMHDDAEAVTPSFLINWPNSNNWVTEPTAGTADIGYINILTLPNLLTNPAYLGVNVFFGDSHLNQVVSANTLLTVTATPPFIGWSTYAAGSWSPSDTTRDVTVKYFLGSEQIASRILNATLDDSGADEGDVGVVAGTATGEATTVSIALNNSNVVTATVTHTASGIAKVVSFSTISNYSGSPGK